MNIEKQIREILADDFGIDDNILKPEALFLTQSDVTALIDAINHIFAIDIPEEHEYFKYDPISIEGLIKLVEEAMAEEKRDYKKLFEKLVDETTCPYGYHYNIGIFPNKVIETLCKKLGCAKCEAPDKNKEKQCWEKYLEGNNE